MKNKVAVISLVILIILALGGSYYLYQRLAPGAEQGTSAATSSTPSPTASAAPSPSASSDASAAPTEDAQTQNAPDFTVYDEKGNQVSLSSFTGKPVVVNFWASWCPPCKAELPYFQSAYEKYGKDIRFLMVNLTGDGNDTKEDAQTLITQSGYSFPVYYDTDNAAAIAYSIRSIPMSCFITADGKIQSTHTGGMSQEMLETQIQALLTADK